MLIRLALLTATLSLALAARAQAADSAAKTQNLISVLKSDATLFEKARACQQLGEIGTPEAVPPLAELLTDPKLSAYARSGLEGIPDRSAAAALRDGAKTMKGPLLAGIVNSLGTIRDAQAVEVLTMLAGDPALGVVNQALLALGNISTPASIRFLRETLTSGSATSRGDAAAACLLAADWQRTSGDLEQAAALYDVIRNAEVPTACRAGAVRGTILARKDGRVPFLMEQLRSEELSIRNAALLVIREVSDDALATALNAEIARATPELQIQLLLALADCHNAQSIEAIQPLANSPNPEVRKTALAVLGRLGPGAASVLLGTLQRDLPDHEKAIVLGGLRALQGAEVDRLLRHALSSVSAAELRTDLIQLLESRRVAEATPELMQQAAAQDTQVSISALSALRTLAGPNQVLPLILLTRSSTDDGVREAAENALAAICNRSREPACETLLTALKNAAKASERKSWIRVLARGGCAQALPDIAAAASDPDPMVAESALAELGRWPNPAPIETLLKTLDSGASSRLRKTALASVLDLASTATDEAQAPAPTIVSWLQRAHLVAQSVQEKQRILSLLGRLETIESVRLLVPYLDDQSVRNEAALGLVQIAPALAKGADSGALRKALEAIAAKVQDAGLRDRASQLMKAIESR